MANDILYVEDYPRGSGENYDSARIRRALGAAIDGGYGEVRFAPIDYDLNEPVDIEPVNGLKLSGTRGKTRFLRTASGVTGVAFRLSPDVGETIENVIFEGLTFYGGMTNIDELGTRRARKSGSGPTDGEGGAEIIYADGMLRGAVHSNGDLAVYWNSNSEEVDNPYGVTRNIFVRDCEFLGLQGLPVFFRGARGTTSVEQSHLLRCLDPGWVYCEDARFDNNLSEYSMDNGCSLSRGCVNVRATNNTILAPWFNGVWVAGFHQDPPSGSTPVPKPTYGPRQVVVDGNTIVRPGEHGINGADSNGRFAITGNLIFDAIPPADTGATRGAGIVIGAWDSDRMPLSVTITGNTIENVARSAIDVRNARSITINGNTLRGIGSRNNPDGTPRPGGATQRVGIYVGGLNNLSVISVTGNTVADQRGGAAAMYYGISIPSGAASRVVNGNAVYGSSNGNNLP